MQVLVGMMLVLYACLNLLTVFVDGIPKILSKAEGRSSAPIGLPHKEVDGLLIAASISIAGFIFCFTFG